MLQAYDKKLTTHEGVIDSHSGTFNNYGQKIYCIVTLILLYVLL